MAGRRTHNIRSEQHSPRSAESPRHHYPLVVLVIRGQSDLHDREESWQESDEDEEEEEEEEGGSVKQARTLERA